MAHTITLTTTHQIALIMALDDSLQIKCNYTIKDKSKIDETERQYSSAMLKLTKPVKCGTRQNNLFTWIIDQINHSADYHYTERAQYCIIICQAAAANKYSDFCSTTLEDIYLP
jgi:hypothetical protein